jgi:hypothetical protein
MDFYCDQVLSGRLAVQRVAETEHALVFHHTQPYWTVHIVIIPKRHIASLAELEPGDLLVVHDMRSLAAEFAAMSLVNTADAGSPPTTATTKPPSTFISMSTMDRARGTSTEPPIVRSA